MLASGAICRLVSEKPRSCDMPVLLAAKGMRRMTDCQHNIMHRVLAPSGLRYWACRCGERAKLCNDSRDRALAEFVAAFDEWRDSWRNPGTPMVSLKSVFAARAALDATEDS